MPSHTLLWSLSFTLSANSWSLWPNGSLLYWLHGSDRFHGTGRIYRRHGALLYRYNRSHGYDGPYWGDGTYWPNG